MYLYRYVYVRASNTSTLPLAVWIDEVECAVNSRVDQLAAKHRELAVEERVILIVDVLHYRLVPAGQSYKYVFNNVISICNIRLIWSLGINPLVL